MRLSVSLTGAGSCGKPRTAKIQCLQALFRSGIVVESVFSQRGEKVDCGDMNKKITVVWNRDYLIMACALLAVGFLMPGIATERRFHVYELLLQALHARDTGILLDGAYHLILLNTVRAIPIYLGIMLLMEGLNIKWNQKSIPFIKLPFCCLLQVLLYQAIFFLYRVRLDVGIPSMLVFLCIELLNRFSFRLHNKLTIIILFLITMQGLDILPIMTAFGFGNGEISTDIKTMAQILGGERILSYFSFLLFIPFAITTGLMCLLDRDQRRLTRMQEKAKEAERSLYEARIKNLEMRSFREIQNLVHDLKSPLTTIQGLASLTEALTPDPKLAEYQGRIVAASDKMSQMISEILYEDRVTQITTGQLITMSLSYMASNSRVSKIKVKNSCPDLVLTVNSIRMARALVNVLENSCKAIADDSGRISVEIDAESGWVIWKITDNGVGIQRDVLHHIWTREYSGSGSTGLGLSFVKQVISAHGGRISIDSREGSYTVVWISLPIVREGVQRENDSVH